MPWLMKRLQTNKNSEMSTNCSPSKSTTSKPNYKNLPWTKSSTATHASSKIPKPTSPTKAINTLSPWSKNSNNSNTNSPANHRSTTISLSTCKHLVNNYKHRDNKYKHWENNCKHLENNCKTSRTSPISKMNSFTPNHNKSNNLKK